MTEVERLLLDAQHTIRRLRDMEPRPQVPTGVVRVLSEPPVDDYNAIVGLVRAAAGQAGLAAGGGMSPDICWEIERYIEAQKQPATGSKQKG